jgi:hypothetical protein
MSDVESNARLVLAALRADDPQEAEELAQSSGVMGQALIDAVEILRRRDRVEVGSETGQVSGFGGYPWSYVKLL